MPAKLSRLAQIKQKREAEERVRVAKSALVQRDTDEKEKLISEIEMQPALWNMHLPEYRDKYIGDAAWNAVSDSCGLPIIQCKKKWKGLRDFFVVKYSDARNKKSGAELTQDDIEDNTWSFFSRLMFLKDSVKYRPPFSTSSTFTNMDPIKPTEINVACAGPSVDMDVNAISECTEDVRVLSAEESAIVIADENQDVITEYMVVNDVTIEDVEGEEVEPVRRGVPRNWRKRAPPKKQMGHDNVTAGLIESLHCTDK